MSEYYTCESCGRPVDYHMFMELAKDERYLRPFRLKDEISFGIFHINCAILAQSRGHKIFIHRKQGNLALVEISWESK